MSLHCQWSPPRWIQRRMVVERDPTKTRSLLNGVRRLSLKLFQKICWMQDLQPSITLLKLSTGRLRSCDPAFTRKALVINSCGCRTERRRTHAMTDIHKDKEAVGEVETAMLDADLFLKYGSPERAMKRLKTALERIPRSIPLREKMREVAASHKHPEEAARQDRKST